MQKINYLSILKKSWGITWQNKKLWWFGLFLALTSTGSSFSWSNKQNKQTNKFDQQFLDFFAAHQTLVITILAILLIICIVLLVMRFLSRGALIASVEKISKNPAKTNDLDFKKGIGGAKKYFWRLFLLTLLIQIAVGIIFALIASPVAYLFMTKAYALGTLLTLVGIVIMVPLFILAFFLRSFGSIYIVLSNLPLFNSIEVAYNLFRKNMRSSIVMALIFIPISIALCLAIIFALVFLAIIFLIIGFIFSLVLGKIGALVIAGIAIIFVLILLLAFRSIFETFYQSVWIFFFQEIASPKVLEEIAETEPAIEPTAATTPDPA